MCTIGKKTEPVIWQARYIKFLINFYLQYDGAPANGTQVHPFSLHDIASVYEEQLD